jgi:hypothetical protein
MQWLNDCNTLAFDRDAVWEFYDGGRVADRWLGWIEDMTWRLDDDGRRLHIESESWPPGVYFIYESNLSEDCTTLEDGIMFTTDDPGSTRGCWRAERRW